MYFVQICFNYQVWFYFYLIVVIGSLILQNLMVAVLTIKFSEENKNMVIKESVNKY